MTSIQLFGLVNQRQCQKVRVFLWGKKLRIGVPKTHGFTEFVHAVLDPQTNRTELEGYSIDKFDAVVGDTTIGANRSKYVDFTLPYIESGLTMIVLAKNNKENAWIFLKPLRLDLWLMTGAAFIFTGAVVWALQPA
ncbi:glutamate receptor 2.8-like protein [Cinnamomum micranthum f. kanehirae]|uniref:Glutamate receptor 2.8-like protein n=1 Tax=Cinnamomum micranthum f. kanehirae TaxID=337451 RepID=A0A3S3M901_9MAGN|nr:glutamate receptor 2.8-like protein [Cinnamomum micranthum f. kanehirae]